MTPGSAGCRAIACANSLGRVEQTVVRDIAGSLVRARRAVQRSDRRPALIFSSLKNEHGKLPLETGRARAALVRAAPTTGANATAGVHLGCRRCYGIASRGGRAAAELVRLEVGLIVTSFTLRTMAAKQATTGSDVPIGDGGIRRPARERARRQLS